MLTAPPGQGCANAAVQGAQQAFHSFIQTPPGPVQTWPAFSVERNSNCGGSSPANITGSWGVGCSSFANFTLDQYVYFLQTLAVTVGAPLDMPYSTYLYEAAFLPTAWMQQLGLRTL